MAKLGPDNNSTAYIYMPLTSFDGPLLGFKKSRSRGKDKKTKLVQDLGVLKLKTGPSLKLKTGPSFFFSLFFPSFIVFFGHF